MPEKIDVTLTLSVTVGVIASTITVQTVAESDEACFKRLEGKLVYDLLLWGTGLWAGFKKPEYHILLQHAQDLYHHETGRNNLSKQEWLNQNFIAEFRIEDRT